MSSESAETLKADPPTPHDFRRTVATGLAALGVSREDRKAVLAHVESDVHGVHYDKYERLKEKRAALELWEKQIEALIEERLAMKRIAWDLDVRGQKGFRRPRVSSVLNSKFVHVDAFAAQFVSTVPNCPVRSE